jgi:hypothetical protein
MRLAVPGAPSTVVMATKIIQLAIDCLTLQLKPFNLFSLTTWYSFRWLFCSLE